MNACLYSKVKRQKNTTLFLTKTTKILSLFKWPEAVTSEILKIDNQTEGMCDCREQQLSSID